MKIIKCFIPIVLSVLWIYFLQKPIVVGDNTIPPLGKFMSPFTGFWQNVKATKSFQNTILSTMPKEGKVIFDERMVPHIFAQTTSDAYFMQGYVHAMHRLWQMDFSTRAAEGRISEIIGTLVLIIGGSALYAEDGSGMSPYLVGVLVWGIGLSLGGPTGYAINPARDLGPRIAHAILPIAGKGGSDWGYAWVPVLGPVIAAVIAGAIMSGFGF